MPVLWVAVPCSLIDMTSVSEVLTASIHRPDDGISKVLRNAVSVRQISRCNTPEDSHLQIEFKLQQDVFVV
jgi:hypothetical protein